MRRRSWREIEDLGGKTEHQLLYIGRIYLENTEESGDSVPYKTLGS